MKRGNLTNRQKAVLHQAKAKLGWDDAQYRIVLKNICGVTSSTKMNQADYDRMIEHVRMCGLEIGSSPKSKKIAASSRQIFYINQLLKDLPGVNLAGVIHQITGDASTLEECRPQEIGQVINALHAIMNRQNHAAASPSTEPALEIPRA